MWWWWWLSDECDAVVAAGVGRPVLLTLLALRCRAGSSAARRGSLSGSSSNCSISARDLQQQQLWSEQAQGLDQAAGGGRSGKNRPGSHVRPPPPSQP